MSFLKKIFGSTKLDGDALAQSAAKEEYAQIDLLSRFVDVRSAHSTDEIRLWDRVLPRPYAQQIELFQKQGWLSTGDKMQVTAAARPFVDTYQRRQENLKQQAMHGVRKAIAQKDTSEALDIRRESPELRDRYGRHLFGQSCLMARRLVESGVRFVTVHYDCVDGYSWDSHRNSDDVKKHLLPTFDQGCSALLADLSDRGLLDETLVVALGEMGRTPKGNATWGRNHWSTLFPALLAGAGVVGGTTYGRSDRLGERPDEGLVTPEDLAATVYRSLGIDPQLTLPDALGRPIPIVENGTPLTGLLTV